MPKMSNTCYTNNDKAMNKRIHKPNKKVYSPAANDFDFSLNLCGFTEIIPIKYL